MTNVKSENMQVRNLWNIRDARGLTYAEKAFLFTVASRGVMSSKWQTASADMGMSKTTYYETRTSLLEKGLIDVGRRFDNTTIYRVNADALAALVPESHSEIGNDFSEIGNDDSAFGNDHSGIHETKVTTKETMKETKKETGVSIPPNNEVTDSSSLPNNEVHSPSKVEGEVEAHSEIRNEDEPDFLSMSGFEYQRYMAAHRQPVEVGSDW